MRDEPLYDAQCRARADKGSQILRAAVRLWGTLGYHRVPMQRIANDADVSLACLQRQFPSKPALLVRSMDELASVCEVARRRLVALRRTAPQQLHARQLATGMTDPITQLSREGAHGRQLLRLWAQHWCDPLPELEAPLRLAHHPLNEALVDILAQQGSPHSRPVIRSVCRVGFASAIMLMTDEANDADTPFDPLVPQDIVSALLGSLTTTS